MRFSSILVLLAGFIAITHYSFSQPSPSGNKDSLYQVLSSSKDTTRVDILNVLTDEYLFSNDDSAFHYGKLALDLAHKLHYKKGQREAYSNLGIIYGMRGDYVHSLEVFTRLLRLLEESHDQEGQAAALSNIAKLYKEQENYTDALKCLEQAKAIDKAINNLEGLSSDYMHIGVIKKTLGDLSGAFENQVLSLKINYELQDTASIAITLINISEITCLQKKYTIAKDSAQKALDLFTRSSNSYGELHALHCIGAAYTGLKQYDKAIEYNLRAIEIAQKQEWHEQEAEIYGTLTKAMALSGNYKSAFEYLQKQQVIKDTLFNKEKTKIINEIKEKYDTEKREQRIDFLEQEAAYQARLRMVYIISSLLVLSLLVLIIRNIRRRNRVLQQEKHMAEQNLLLEQEKAHLTEQRLEHERDREILEKERMRQEQERILLENERIALELDENQRQLLTSTLQVQQNREMLTEFQKTISTLKRSKEPDDLKKGIDQIIKSLHQQIDLNDDWEHIKLQFEKVHPSFFNTLKERFPNLTLTELKLCAYTKMNFNGKEISRLLNINPSSIQVARYRLKKKMNLPEEINFPQFIIENF